MKNVAKNERCCNGISHHPTYLSLEEGTCETQDLVTFPSTFVGPCFVGVLGMISTERKKERDRRREIRIL